VFIAGILIGDERAPYKREVERFHTALARLAEIVAFILLGLTIHLAALPGLDAWPIGLGLAVLLVFAIRPLLVGLLLWPVHLRRGERLFVLWTGLKGAVPILLGTFVLDAGVRGADQIYGIIFVVVAFSVIVQGGLVPTLARRLGVPLHTVEPEPWSLGVRFRQEPEALHRHQVASGSPADGTAIADLPFDDEAWVSVVIRRGNLVPVRDDTQLQAGDEVLVVADPQRGRLLRHLFQPTPGGDGRKPPSRP